MSAPSSSGESERRAAASPEPRQDLPAIWGRRGAWQVALRWWAAPAVVLTLAAAHLLGFGLPVRPILVVAVAILGYNVVLALVFRWLGDRLDVEPQLERRLAVLQALADYVAVLALIVFTGGEASPLVFFLLFHVIIAAIQFRPSISYLFAALAAAGLWLVYAGRLVGRIPVHAIAFRGETFDPLERPAHVAGMLVFFTLAMFMIAVLATWIMRRFRERVVHQAATNRRLAAFTERLEGLHVMACAIVSEHRLEPVLGAVTRELARLLPVDLLAVMLLREDGRTLRVVSLAGLSERGGAAPAATRDVVVSLDDTPLTRQVVRSSRLLHLRAGPGETLPLVREFADLGVRSAVVAPLVAGGQVLGSLGAYSRDADRFEESDRAFVRLAAELAAIAIDSARVHDAAHEVMRAHTGFMTRVAHDLQAPIGASLNVLELLRDGYLGEVTEKQADAVARIDKRLHGLRELVGELLLLARTRDRERPIEDVRVSLSALVADVEARFAEEARRQGLRFHASVEADLPEIDTGAGLLEPLLENLVSNAIKYTPTGGEVELRVTRLGPDECRIVVHDTGIGIPDADRSKLFTEFFRASNARDSDVPGTGLGLAFVHQVVDRHGGRIAVDSAPGQGTTMTVELPFRQSGGAPRPQSLPEPSDLLGEAAPTTQGGS